MKSWHPALALLRKSMPLRGVPLTAEVYRAALVACGRCHEAGEVRKLLEEMQARRVLNIRSTRDMHALVLEAAGADGWGAALMVCQQYFGIAASGKARGAGYNKKVAAVFAAAAEPVSLETSVMEGEMLESTIEVCRRTLREAHRKNERAMLARMHERLWGVVQEARRTRGVELSKGAWTSLIQVGSKAGKTYDVSLMMEAMVADGVEGESRLGERARWRKVALQRCWVNNDWVGARRILEEMWGKRESEAPPQSDALLHLVMSCGLKGGMEREALQLFEAWWDADLTFSPGSRCRILASRCALRLAHLPASSSSLSSSSSSSSSSSPAAAAAAAAAAAEEEIEAGVEQRPASATGLGPLGSLLDRFDKRAPGQKAIVCNMVMEHVRVKGLVREGLSFLHAMRALHIPRKSLTLLPLLKLCASSGRLQEMVKLVEEMKEKDQVAPTAHMYSQTIEAATSAGMVDEALRLFTTMNAEGVAVGEGSCIDLMSALARNGDWSRALDLLQDVRACTKRPPTCIIYTTAVNACGNGGAWEMALMLMKRMEEEGIAPNKYTYGAAIKACARAGKWEQAEQLFAEMDERGIARNEVTFTAILDAYAKAGRARDAATCLEVMKTKGLRPSTPHYTAVIDACSRTGEYRQALRWLEEMKKEEVPINTLTYSASLSACGKGGAWDEAVRVLLNILSTGERPSSVIYMLTIDACRRADQWPVAAYLWDMVEFTDSTSLDQPTLNSLICSMEHPALLPTMAWYYKRAYESGRVNHWSLQFFRVMDLHNFSRPLSKAALYHVLTRMLEKYGPEIARGTNRSSEELTIEAAAVVAAARPSSKKMARGTLATTDTTTNDNTSSKSSKSTTTVLKSTTNKKWSPSEMYLPWPRKQSRHGYIQDPHNPLIIVTGHGRRRAAGTSILRDDVSDFLKSEFHPPLATETVPYNPGRLLVPSQSLLAYVRAMVRSGAEGKGGGGGK
eukprot:evm.model.NODE_3416_length_12565_cov_27.536489.2